MITKKQLRKETLAIRNNLTLDERHSKSHAIAMQVTHCDAFLTANKILLYAANKSEVATAEIHETARRLGKSVYYPKVEGTEMEFYLSQDLGELQKGFRGILEPVACQETRMTLETTDKICIIMPGAVFDRDGNRIGYGGGYYDKYLQKIKSNTASNEIIIPNEIVSIAICFACQIVDNGVIPVEEFDIKYDLLITK